MLRIAVPVRAGAFCEHFGRCDGFLLCDVDPTGQVDRHRELPRPKQRCETVPQWLKSLGVNVVLAGGLGVVAQRALADLGVTVIPGQTGEDPLKVVASYIATPRADQTNPCATFEHRHHHCNE